MSAPIKAPDILKINVLAKNCEINPIKNTLPQVKKVPV